jgi:hypothetical protein
MKKVIKGNGHPSDVMNMRAKGETRAGAGARRIKELPGVAGGHDGEQQRGMKRR